MRREKREFALVLWFSEAVIKPGGERFARVASRLLAERPTLSVCLCSLSSISLHCWYTRGHLYASRGNREGAEREGKRRK